MKNPDDIVKWLEEQKNVAEDLRTKAAKQDTKLESLYDLGYYQGKWDISETLIQVILYG